MVSIASKWVKSGLCAGLVIVYVLLLHQVLDLYGLAVERMAVKRVTLQVGANASFEFLARSAVERKSTTPDTAVRNKVLLFAQWRSGSSFVGGILKCSPDSFYMFEPLMFFHLEKPSAIGNLLLTQYASHFISAVLDCNISYIKWVSEQFWPTETRFRNKWIKRAFGGLQSFEMAEDQCKAARNVIAKIIKVPRLEFVNASVTRDDVRIIYLVRDPRGVFMSRSPFLKTKYRDRNLKSLYMGHYREEMRRLCQNMVLNYDFIEANKNSLNDRLLVVRYEDIAYHPTEMTSQMYSFLGFNKTTALEQWLTTATSSKPKSKDPFSTQRQSAEVAESWKTKISASLLQMIQNDCHEALVMYNYTLIT